MHFTLPLIKVVLLSFLAAIATTINAQEAPCPLPRIPANVDCAIPAVKGKFYTKNIVTDFGADPTGKTNSHVAFSCAARFFNLNGGQGKLIIPYGTYLVGLQTFVEANKNTCPHWTDYGWIGMDLLHLADCKNLQVMGVASNGRKPVIRYMANIRLGGFKKDGTPSKYVNNPDKKRFNIPATCTESEQADTYQSNAGTAFYIDNCTNITISGIEIDGNSAHYSLGAYIGPGKSPYEVWSHGIAVWNSRNTSLLDIDIHDIAVDGIMIRNFTDEGMNTEDYRTVLRNLKILKSGRNNISWIGGNGLTLTNSTLGLASSGVIKTDPGASLDVEPETHVKKSDRCHSILVDKKYITINDYCINATISNNYFYEDRLFTLLNADRTGHAKNIKVTNCKIVNKNARAFYSVKENSIEFNQCTITGKWVINEVHEPPIKNDPKIKNSSFQLK